MAINNDPLFVDPVLLQQAEQLCNQRLRTDPDNRAVLRSLAEVYRKLGNLEGAATAYERLSWLDPLDQEAGYMQAVLGGRECPTAPKRIRAAPYVIMSNFLPRDFHDALLPFLISARDKFVPGLISDRKGGAHYMPDYRETLNFSDKWEGKERFRNYLTEALSRVTPRLHLAPSKIDYIEVYLRAYQDGQLFEVHVDTRQADPATANRIVSFVYFFHRLPRPYSGGELLLFDSDPEADKMTRAWFTRVVPEDNSVVIFPSNIYHCVVPVRCPSKEFADSRFVINGFVRKWMAADGPVGSHGEAAAAF